MFNNQIAILFDSENVKPHEILDLLFDKLEKQGFTLIYPRKLIVHDLNKIKKNELIEDLKKYRLELCCTYGEFRKNLLDFRLYVECLDLAYTTDIPTFCIVSNDQDYAELCIKLHTLNKKVIGVGSNKTSTVEYISLFDDYIFVEDLKPKEKQVKAEVKKESKTKEVLQLEHAVTVEDKDYKFPPITLLSQGDPKVDQIRRIYSGRHGRS